MRRAADNLTPRELDVLSTFAAEGTYKGAAVRMSCSPETVKSHLSNVRDKIGVSTSTQAVAVAIRKGLI